MLARLRDEYEGSGRGRTFGVLKRVLTDGPRSVPQADLARRLGMSEGAVQVAVHRIRRRYRDMMRESLAATVDGPAQVEDEIRDLFAALAD